MPATAFAVRVTGTIVRLDDIAGFGVVRDPASKRNYTFTFDQIPSYRGESARELGLAVGSDVQFDINYQETLEQLVLK